MKQKLFIGLTSLSILLAELFWTRLFSAEYYYTFAFLILSFAVLGIGLGALTLNLFRRLNNERFLPIYALLCGLMLLISVPATFALHLDFSTILTDKWQIPKLFSVILLLGSGYYFGGIVITLLLNKAEENVQKLYMADLFGAATGVIIFVVGMNVCGAQFMYVATSIPVLMVSFLSYKNWTKLLPAVILLLVIGFLFWNGGLPEQKRKEPAKVIYTHWDAISKIKIYEFDSTARGINIDNVANTPVYRFDGNWNMPDSLKFQFAIDVKYLVKQFDRCRFLSLGAGGGSEVLQALQNGAAEIHAVEVNPHINYLLKEGNLKNYTGNIYNDPRVSVITEDGRAYVRQFSDRFDIIYSLSSNTFAAFASGSFALAENYLYTTEAFMDYWRALSSKGYLMMEHQFYTARLVPEILEALKRLGVEKPENHIAVYNLPQMRRKILLVSKNTLDQNTIMNAVGEITPATAQFLQVIHPQQPHSQAQLINKIITEGWEKISDTVKADISPCSDNRPFIAQMGLMRNFELSKIEKGFILEFSGFPLAKSIILLILAICLVIVVPLNIIPAFKKGEKLNVRSWLYYFSIGMGYMMIEVIVIQKFSLFIGASIYSLLLVLTVLLLASGIGSAHAQRYSIRTVFGGLIVGILVITIFASPIFSVSASLPLIGRLCISALLLLLPSYFMGMPFPRLASIHKSLIPWAFAVNGSASLIGSILVVLIAFNWGYSVALLIGATAYFFAMFLYSEKS
ncbi:MAG: hypothetical protein LWX56_02145 [Ignavibacteria bacterium]|nr:hypothetical protein [Ignavibacteria bacterium]